MARYWFSRSFGNNSGGSAAPPAAATLAVTDNADNTGGVATVSGGDAGATNTVYSQRVDGELGAATWTSRGSRAGNGTITLAIGGTLTAGYYWWRVQSVTAGGSAESNLVYQPLSDGSSAVLYRCLTAVQARIQGLGLSGIANASVVIRQAPLDRHFKSGDLVLPGVVLAPVLTEQMNTTAGTNTRDDVGYPIGCFILAAGNQAIAPTAAHYKWREQIARAFRNQKLPGVSEVWSCVVEPAAINDPGAWERNLYVSAMVLRFFAREVRGI
jgi:hypothetical protein